MKSAFAMSLVTLFACACAAGAPDRPAAVTPAGTPITSAQARASTLASPSAPGTASVRRRGLAIHIDRDHVRAGEVIEVSLENESDTPVTIPYSGGSNGCAVPVFRVSLLDSQGHRIEVAPPEMICTAVMVEPGAIEVTPHSKQEIGQIRTAEIPQAPFRPGVRPQTKALAAGTYEVRLELSRGVAPAAEAASFTLQ